LLPQLSLTLTALDATSPPTDGRLLQRSAGCVPWTRFTAFWCMLIWDVEIPGKENAGTENGRRSKLRTSCYECDVNFMSA